MVGEHMFDTSSNTGRRASWRDALKARLDSARFAVASTIGADRRVSQLASDNYREDAMGTSNVWMYQDTLRTEIGNGADIVGYEVEATDGSIGKVDKRSAEAGRDYLVVDTGFWIFGHKRLIPAGVVRRVDHNDRKVFVSMTKEEIKNAPDFDEAMNSTDDAYYDKHSSYYSQYGW